MKLTYPYATPPDVGTVHFLTDTIGWIRHPLPFKLDHINVWVVRDDDGWTIIDTGLANQTTRDAWHTIHNTALAQEPIQRVIGTHLHPDHIGAADWLCATFNCRL
jgi:glyoxylase-like metal-dependent hydrolase (beta-lactamase superfamily II)